MALKPDPQPTTLWPNQQEVVDGVTPTIEISQSPGLFDNDTTDILTEMRSN